MTWILLVGFGVFSNGGRLYQRSETATATATVVVAVAATLGLLHPLLFVFEPRDRQNLWFVALAASFALVEAGNSRPRLPRRRGLAPC